MLTYQYLAWVGVVGTLYLLFLYIYFIANFAQPIENDPLIPLMKTTTFIIACMYGLSYLLYLLS